MTSSGNNIFSNIMTTHLKNWLINIKTRFLNNKNTEKIPIKNRLINIKNWVLNDKNAEDNYEWIKKATGIYLIIRFCSLLPHSAVLFSDQGVNIPWMIDVPEPNVIMAFLLTTSMIVGGALFLIRNTNPKIIWGVLLVYTYLAMVEMGSSSGSFEMIQMCLLFFLGFAASFRTQSWMTRMFQIHVINIYLFASLHKYTHQVWGTGTIFGNILYNNWGGTELCYQILPFLNQPGIIQMAEYAVILTQLGLAIAFLSPLKYKIIPIVVSFLLHLSIGILLQLPEFLNMFILTLAFLTPADKNFIKNLALKWPQKILSTSLKEPV